MHDKPNNGEKKEIRAKAENFMEIRKHKGPTPQTRKGGQERRDLTLNC